MDNKTTRLMLKILGISQSSLAQRAGVTKQAVDAGLKGSNTKINVLAEKEIEAAKKRPECYRCVTDLHQRLTTWLELD